jgi:hypothetical protein
MFQILENLQKEQIKKIILICGVGFFTIHSLYFITVLGVNYPYIDDWEIIEIGIAYHNNESNWYEKIFEQASEHRPTIPRIIQTFSLFFDSFNVVNSMYLSWGLLIISIYALYGILKRADRRLTWLIIPIAGFVFNPKQIDTMVYALGSLHWVIVFVTGVVTIYFLSNPNINKKILGLAIFASIIGTFTAIIGLIVWIVGFFSLNPKYVKSKKFLIVWSLATFGIILFYLLTLDSSKGNIMGLIKIETLISEEKIVYMLNYISNPFSVKFPFIRIFIGIFVISGIIISSIYLKYKIRYKEALPWIQFAGIGFLATLGTVLTRSSRSPFDTRYIVISNFLEIALMVLISMTILNLIKLYPNKKKILITMLMIFLISQMGLLGTGYYNGWNLAQERYDEMQTTISCGKLPTDWKSCEALIDQGDYKWERISVLLNFVIENKLNLLSENSFNQENSNNIKMLNYEDRKNNEKTPGLGEISLINNQEDYSISVKNNEPLIIISGWIQGENNEKISDVFLLIDEKPFVKANLHNSDQINLLQKGSWTTSFFSGYIEEGCHNIQVIGISIEKTIFLKDQRQICITR